jgi:glycosyltransferase involved in cell wall biosynthesis
MASRPRFSVVLPTIGRIEYLKDAIESVRWQSFRDFELIVSDNSADGTVKSIVDEYRADDRIRYVRPREQMMMPDHWEFASLHANGEFVFILQDRVVVLPDALEIADREIGQLSDQPSVVYWPHISNYDDRTGRVSRIDAHTAISEIR